jgi:hypothetical protein
MFNQPTEGQVKIAASYRQNFCCSRRLVIPSLFRSTAARILEANAQSSESLPPRTWQRGKIGSLILGNPPGLPASVASMC